MLELRSICFSYLVKGPLILDTLDLKLRGPGAFLILGNNGSGKSTLMDVVSGFKRPAQGKVIINGVDLYGTDTATYELSKLISYMPASLKLPNNLYVDDLLEFYAGPHHPQALCTELGLDKVRNKKYSELSDGYKTRLALNICLSKGAYVFLDEPLKSQDEQLRKLFPLILKKYASGRTVVVCSPHNIDAVEWNTSYAIKNGRLLEC